MILIHKKLSSKKFIKALKDGKHFSELNTEKKGRFKRIIAKGTTLYLCLLYAFY